MSIRVMNDKQRRLLRRLHEIADEDGTLVIDAFRRHADLSEVVRHILCVRSGQPVPPATRRAWERACDDYDDLPWWRRLFTENPRRG